MASWTLKERTAWNRRGRRARRRVRRMRNVSLQVIGRGRLSLKMNWLVKE